MSVWHKYGGGRCLTYFEEVVLKLRISKDEEELGWKRWWGSIQGTGSSIPGWEGA